jgi:conjugal transfer pilus assembly protein TraE
MKIDLFNASWGKLVAESHYKTVLVVLLAITNIIATVGWLKTRETVVLVPPYLDEKVEVSFNDASDGYKKAWALSVTQLIGNISPSNVDFLLDSLSSMLSPEVFQSLRGRLVKQIQDIQEEQLSISFESQKMAYEKETDKVFIYGEMEAVGPSRVVRKKMRTYEYKVTMRFGRPWITHFAIYKGAPRTLLELKKQPDFDPRNPNNKLSEMNDATS